MFGQCGFLFVSYFIPFYGNCFSLLSPTTELTLSKTAGVLIETRTAYSSRAPGFVMGYVLWWGTCCDGVRFVMGSRVAGIFNYLCCVLCFVCLYSQYRIQCCNWPFRFLYRINDIKPNPFINSMYVFSFTFFPLYDIIVDRTHNNFKVKFPIYEFSITIFRSFVKHVS